MISEAIDTIYRSRITLLDHLEESGYSTTPYRKFSHKEVGEMVKAGPPALNMSLKKGEGSAEQTCLVAYTLTKIKQKIKSFTETFTDPEVGFDPEKMELIVVTLEPIAPNFNQVSASYWNTNKTRVRYFQAAAIINNPLKHIFVPKHEIVPKEQEDDLLKGMYTKKSQLPIIRFHEDPIARMIGAFPGDIVKITRPSASAGECVIYRVCIP
jgi:DNA-directed RNA polymerase subunit H (RpoH/RPB5)